MFISIFHFYNDLVMRSNQCNLAIALFYSDLAATMLKVKL